MTIAMKNSGEGGTPVGNESSQETSAIGNTTPNQNSPAAVNTDGNTNGQNAKEKESDEEAWLDPTTGEPYFPVNELARLEEMISRTRWVVPVLPKCELEILLDAAINLCKRELDTRSEACQRFFQDGLTKSFTKILTDDAVSSWKFEIHRCILRNCEKLIELCVSKLSQDWFPLLELLAIVLNPQCKFHTFNLTRPAELYPLNANGSDEEVFAKSPDIRAPRGWLVDLINRFGKLNGFQLLLERFQSEQNLSLPVMFALIRPFGLCNEMLTIPTITKYFLPIVEVIPAFLDNLTDEELKKESKNEGKNDLISALVKFLKSLAQRVPGQEETLQNLEMFRLKMILRLLQISSFNGKMNALNEINKVIASVASYPHRTTGNSVVTGANETDEEWLTAERMAAWLKEHRVLQIVLADSLHQPQYVEKLEKILRFVIKEKALTLEDLDRVWASQAGKHEAIVKNVHDLLAKLAWDFSPEQLDHLFECFQASWTTAGKKQREKLLELIRRLAEDDKDGVMAHKVLTLFWNLAHSPDVPNEIIDQAMNAHVKILDYSCSQDRDTQKTVWLDRCVEEIRLNVWVLQALKQIRDICCLYAETPANYNHATNAHAARAQHVLYRQEVVNRLQQQHALVILITDNLCAYMERVRSTVKDNPANYDPLTHLPDGRYSHVLQVQERLSFLRFLLKDGQLWLCAPQARQIWHCLVERAVFVADREACFKWFSKLMGEEPDLDPEVNREFFEAQILQLDPSLMTESGMKCFDRFFKAVNAKEGKLVARRKMNDVGLIGLDYLWRVILFGNDAVAEKAIHLLKETYTSLGPRLVNSQVEIHEDLIGSCSDRLRASHDTLRAYMIQQQQQQPHEALVTEKDFANRSRQETTRMCRLLKLLQEYVSDYDCEFHMREERTLLPLGRAHRGKCFTLIVRFPNQGRQLEDIEVWTHSNETLATVRRRIMARVKSTNQTSTLPVTAGANSSIMQSQIVGHQQPPVQQPQQQQSGVKLDLYLNNELIEPSEGYRLVADLPLRDKTMLTAKLSQSNTAVAGSPDSSSDSSTGGSPQHAPNSYQGAIGGQLHHAMTAAAAEGMLPGVLMSRDKRINPFLCQLADLGSQLQHAQLRDAARNLLRQLPADPQAIERLVVASQVLPSVQSLPSVAAGDKSESFQSPSELESIFIASSPSTTLYHLEVAYSLLMPANMSASDRTSDFQLGFILRGGIPLLLKMLSANSFLSTADIPTKRSAYLSILRLSKVVLAVMSSICMRNVLDSPGQNLVLHTVTSCAATDSVVRAVASRLAQHMQTDSDASLLLSSIKPDEEVARSLVRLTWASSSGDYQLLESSWNDLGMVKLNTTVSPTQENEYSEDILLCKEALEVLTVVNSISPRAVYQVSQSNTFYRFSLEMILLCPVKALRLSAAEQFLLISSQSVLPQANPPTDSPSMLAFFLDLLFSVMASTVPEYAKNSQEFFQLLCRLLNLAATSNVPLPSAEPLLLNEINWLQRVRDSFLKTGSTQTEDDLLEGHLCLTRELISYLGLTKKYEIGSDPSKSVNLIKELLEDFLYPASRIMAKYNSTGELLSAVADPICSTPASVVAALELLVALCSGCVANLKLLTSMLTDMFFSDQQAEPLSEWEYLPPVGPRASWSFVGLKNAGATCYMNSVLQQLFMIERLRRGVLLAQGAALDPDEDFNGDEKMENDTENSEDQQLQLQQHQRSRDESTREYNINILKQLQAIFGHLACSKLQYYVPRGLWRHFKLQGEPVNLREQQDAVEFYMSLTDSVDEALKALGHEQIMHRTLVGIYSDQKICKGCPHRYCKEQPFNVISIDIRNHSNLHDSLEQYVKGELLEGGDAYHCEKCNKKVNTVKRLCVKKLPPILAIQLKRFEYDYERLCPIKFNDYFEFPRLLDMEPYTVWGLAKAEGEVIDYDMEEEANRDVCTRYQLTGIVVHSGQASGGHYYSYILHRPPPNATGGMGGTKWYKFDDGDVSECKMDDDEEMKNQCFGGEYMGEVFDHVVKRMSYRRQKRWWNAYILFYTKEDIDIGNRLSELTINESVSMTSATPLSSPLCMPLAIERSVRKQNIKFQHTYNQFSTEYFHFMRKLISCQTPYLAVDLKTLSGKLPIHPSSVSLTPAEVEELALSSVEIGAHFLFTTCFHTKKSLRGVANDWYEALLGPLRVSKQARLWFGQHVLLDHPHRFCEYLLQCPSAEVRSAFVKILVFLAHLSLSDGPCEIIAPSTSLPGTSSFPSSGVVPAVSELTLADHIFQSVLSLLSKEVADYGRHLSQYFNLFLVYASLGPPEKAHLLRLNVLATFMTVALDEGPGPPIKYQYAELGKLYQVVCMLIRCCDISSKANSSVAGQPPLPNSFGEPPLMPIQPQVAEILYTRNNFVKKLLEDASGIEETSRLLRYCCWENNHFSFVVLSEILWQVAFAYTYELRPHLDLLLCILSLEDSWQKYRITAALKGIPDDRDGLFDIIQRSKNHYHKRAYQCIKCLVALFSSCPAAHQILLTNAEFKRKWSAAVDWLHEELDRPYPTGNNQYNQWSPPAQSNETSNGYFLERSHSARLTLDKSIELCPEEEVETEDVVGIPSGGGSSALGVGDDNVVPPPALVADIGLDNSTAALVKSQTLARAAFGVSQPRPGHAQTASPRATAPPTNSNLSIPRSSSSQFPPLHPNRPQQPPVKNEGSGSSQSGPSPTH
ncbi:probable ubiquitin carboxyl-terminal hydrolase FAF-X [Daphnia magna]|uniref:USP domain-containing protein n=1 Tax=Daphnia magna TaxID=35525 RepID=A0ABR0AS19_9CRUS|nr:probable ubiquitin carboxyl-terminal hydrolase FAF-X [Daphnia magna]XP_032790225.2 probable ubiquitin carboxyl-terminal hydrolase FAF-X [Daphnia magna]XP_032790228.2 probable ubiquitin carboxyl-terminal hydrolase FAF-X [Daphnia magna]KAK4027909.1 hypothetical protein OUZ56_017050 [Daphnia magna]